MIRQCPCGFATDDQLWFESHQAQHVLKREHDVSQMTTAELERARRELTASLALARPDSPARVPILARLSAIDTALLTRPTGGRIEGLPGSPFAWF
jgi:hypothetical protein